MVANPEEEQGLRIDYSKYEVDELVETISDAIFFPLYIGKVAAVVVLVAFSILLLLMFQGTANWFTAFLFMVLGFAVTLPSVVLFTVIRLFSTIKADLKKVYAITIETAEHVYSDTNKLKEQRTQKIAAKHTFSDVFKGVALYVIRPTLKRVLKSRIKFFAPPFVWLVDIIFKKTVIKNPPKLEELAESELGLDVIGKTDSQEQVKKGLGVKIVDAAFITLKFPFRLALVLYGIFNTLLLVVLIYIL